MSAPASADRIIFAHALTGFRAIVRPPAPTAFSYASQSYLPMLVALLAVGAPPDVILRHLIVPHAFWLVNVAIDLLSISSVLWIAGLWGTVVSHPHELCDETVTFRQGILRIVEVPRTAIIAVQYVDPAQTKAQIRRRYAGAVILRSGATPMLCVSCAPNAATVRSYPLYRRRPVSEIVVAADRPRELAALLTG